MIYFALRSSQNYFAKLARVREAQKPNQIVSVTGGLAFLHAIGPQTQALWLRDTDIEVLNYARMILSLVKNCSSLKEFIEVLSGYQVEQFGSAFKFKAKLDENLRSSRLPSDLSERELFIETYGKIDFDTNNARGQIGESTVLFTGFSLTPMSFCWRFGEGVLADQKSYQVLREKLNNIPISIELDSLENFNFSTLNPKNKTFFLASNCDSPLFNHADPIFRHVYKNSLGSTIYISWYRDLLIDRNATYQVVAECKLIDTVTDRNVFSLRYELNEVDKSKCRSFTSFLSEEELRKSQSYGGEVLLLDLLADNRELNSKELNELFDHIAPSFLNVVIRSKFKSEDLIEALTSIEFLISYELVGITNLEQGSLVSVKLRGLK